MGNSDPMVVFVVQFVGFITYLATFALSIIGLIVSFVSSVPVIVIMLLVASVMLPWVEYHAPVVDQLEHFMRTVVYPFYETTARPIMNSFRRIFNPTVCFVDAYQLWAYSVIWDAVYPTIVECEGLNTAFRFGEFLFQFLGDFGVDYFLQLKFFDGSFDYNASCTAWRNFYLSFETTYCCGCSDLCTFLVKAPFPFSPVSGQFSDPETCAFAGDSLNVLMEMLDVWLTLIWDILSSLVNWSWNINRPDMYTATLIAGNATFHLSKSYDRAFQLFWDEFMPFFAVDFDGYFELFAEIATFLFKTLNLVWTALINIDQLINYPANRFLTTTMKSLITDMANMVAAPTQFSIVEVAPTVISVGFNVTNYYVSSNSTITPLNQTNVNVGRPRMTYSLCLLVNRTICNPNDPTTACFGTTYAEFLQGMNPCCITDYGGVLVVDIGTGLFEAITHLDSWAHFFTYMDQQPFTHGMRDAIVNGASCLLQALRFIPQGFGFAVQNLLTRSVEWVVSMVDFAVHVITGIITMPYYLFVLPGTDNYVTNYTEAITEFASIQATLINEDDPTSFLNSICFLLNNGLPVPPMPCTSCVAGGFLPVNGSFTIPLQGTVSRKRYDTMQEALGLPTLLKDQSHRVTPFIHYGKEYPTNPWDIGHAIWINSKDILASGVVPFPTHSTVNSYFDKKRAEIASRWNRVHTCREAKRVEWTLHDTRPHEWMRRKRRGDFDCDPNESFHESVNKTSYKRIQFEYVDFIPGPIPLIFENCTNPTPPCFDLCCLPRSLLKSYVSVILLLANMLNGLIQYNPLFQLPVPTTSEFPYYTGELCRSPWNQPCFQTDIMDAAQNVLRVPFCLCNFITLLIPITERGQQQPRICESIVAISDFLASAVQVITNAIMCLVLGGTDVPQTYAYFRLGFFDNDINQLGNYADTVVLRVTDLLRDLFVFINVDNFDIGCTAETLGISFVEAARWVVLTVTSLGTMLIVEPQADTHLPAICWFRVDTTFGCAGTLDQVGMVKQFDLVLDTLLPNPAARSCTQRCNNADPGVGGITTCICEIVNTLIPWRANPTLPVSCELPNVNCMNIDFCCPIVKAGIFLKNFGKFAIRGIVAIWQPWFDAFPQFLTNYIFCSESQEDPFNPGANTTCTVCDYENQFAPPVSKCLQPNGAVVSCGTFTCAKMDILIENLVNPVTGLLACVCPYVSILDSLLSYYFQLVSNNWQNCFCGIDYGVIPGLLNVVRQLAKALLDMLRKSTLACYWKPSTSVFTYNATSGLCQPAAVSNLYDPTNSFVFRVFSPVSNALCIAVGNTMCILNSVFFLSEECIVPGSRAAGGGVGWGFTVFYRLFATVEGFIVQFTDEGDTCAGLDSTCDSTYGTAVFADTVGANQLAAILTPMLTLPLDLVLADSQIACTSICPRGSSYIKTQPNPCQCYDVAHSTRGTYDVTPAPPINRATVWEPVRVFDATGAVIDPFAHAAAIADMSNVLYVEKGRYFPDYARYMQDAAFWKTVKPGVNVTEYVCRSIQPPSSVIARSSWWAPQYQWSLATAIYLPPCIGAADWSWGISGAQGDPRYNSTCNKNGFCRPDTLPTCGLSQADQNSSPAEKMRDPIRALDGILMSIIRFLSCAVASLTNQPAPPPVVNGTTDQFATGSPQEFSTGTSNFIYPFEVFDSMSWQILSGFIDVAVALIIFMLSFLLALTSDNCDCYGSTDPTQIISAFPVLAGTYSNNGVVKQTIVVGSTDYCYGCPLGGTKDCGCWDSAISIDTKGWMPCGDHCPFHVGDNASCVAVLTELLVTRQNGSPFLQSLVLPPLTSIADACEGKIAGVLQVGPMQYADNMYGKTAFCPFPQCGANALVDAPQIEPVQRPGFWYHRSALDGAGPYCCGCNYYNGYQDYHFFQCGIFGIVTSFLNLIAAFISIFTRQYWIPDGYARRDVAQNGTIFNGPVKRRESWFDMTCRTGITQRTNKSPNPTDHFLTIFYDYDTTDCFDDPTACACRNMYLPEVCRWVNGTVIPMKDRRRRLRTPQNRSEGIPADEITEVIADRFDGYSMCDNVAREMARQTWTNTSYHHKIQWVDCLDQRVQSERISAIRPDIIPTNVIYTRDAPFVIYNNIRSKMVKHIEHRHQRTIRNRHFSEKQRDERFKGLREDVQTRRVIMAKALQEQLPAESPLFQSMLGFDALWYKYQRGYYGYLYNKFVERVEKRAFASFPTTVEAKAHLDIAIAQFSKTLAAQPYSELFSASVNSAYIAGNVVRDAITTGPVQYVRDTYTALASNLYERASRKRDAKNAIIQGYLDQTPLYNWIQQRQSIPSTGPSIVSRFTAHLNRVIEYNRNESTAALNAWNANVHISIMRQHITKMFTPTLSPYKTANWHKLKRVGYQLYNIAFPGALTRQQHERYIFGSSCIFLQRVEVVTTSLLGYCVNEFSDNLDVSIASNKRFIDYSRSILVNNERAFHHKRNLEKYELVIPRDPHAWKRHRFIGTGAVSTERRTARNNVDYRVMKRAEPISASYQGPGGWNLYTWIWSVVQDFINTTFGISANTFLDDVRYWLLNPNTSEEDYPDVGLRYWTLFWFRCRWPDNLNCSKGIGIMNAFWWVTLGVVIAVFLGSYIVPPFLWIFALYGTFALWLMLIGAVGINYSPACLRIYPNFNDFDGMPIANWGMGFNIALPMCLADAVLNITDLYITNCYSPLIIPSYMINGDLCPTNPDQFIDFVSCQTVGVSDGLQNVLYICYTYLGGWALDLITAIANVTVGLFVPGVNTYFQLTIQAFRTANEIQQQREWFCFWFTLPAIALPGVLLFVAGCIIGGVLPFFLLLLLQIWYLLETTPVVDSLPGYDGAFDEDDVDLVPLDFTNVPRAEITAKSIARWIRQQNTQAEIGLYR